MKEVLETLQALYRDSPSSALAVDREMNILWANPAALSCYPVLSLPGGLSLLFSEAQLSEVSSAEGAHTIELAGITRIGFCFAPLEGEGYLVTIGVLADDLHDAGGRPPISLPRRSQTSSILPCRISLPACLRWHTCLKRNRAAAFRS